MEAVRQNSHKIHGCFYWDTKPRWLNYLVASMFACLCLAYCIKCCADSPKSGNLPISERIRLIIGLPAGHNHYLSQYRKIIHFVIADKERLHKSNLSNIWKELSPVQPDIQSLIQAIMKGASATALRDNILQTLTLGAHNIPLNKKKWKYGSILDTIFLLSIMMQRSRQLWKTGHRKQAGECGQAALMLWAQNDIQLGGTGALCCWCNGTKDATANAAALNISPEALTRLKNIYNTSVKLYYDPMMSPQNPFFNIGDTIIALNRKPMPKGLLKQYEHTVQKQFQLCAGRLSEVYIILRSIGSVIRSLDAAGHRQDAKDIAKLLNGMDVKYLVGRNGGKKADAAVKRWINEAMLQP